MEFRLFRIATSRVCVASTIFCFGWPLGSQTPTQPTGTAHRKDAGAVSAPSVPKDEPGEFTISADVDLVLLDISVRDSEGGFVSGLPKEAFTILEDGKPQTITQFANQDVPVSIGLIVDNSGSMRAKKPDVITSALVLIQASNPQDEVFVINFNDKVRRGLPDIVPFTDDVPMLRAALTSTDPIGRTALYDAVVAGLRQLEMGRRDKKTLVVVSDGGDNISTHSFRETQEAVQQSGATIYTVGIYNEEDRDRNPDVLRRLAHLSGGVCYLPKQLSEVQDICRQIAKDIRSRYTVGYVPQNVNKPGVRHIKVDAHSPDHAKLIARTRTNYLVGGASSTADRHKK